jgi:hypothetical protein
VARFATSSFYTAQNPIEMGLRDINAICAAMEPIRANADAAGRAILGLPAARPPFFP